ncbi:rhodanese-like domain-containing protein [Saccharopolyspora sp. SCSIO 74807]|uniref:MBL fold metallo-hydrolase n=1 Tax=Saccharopolyspora sp. SCSIO 74807 TaxID=3118084 RepID=UPI0030CBDB00
MILNQYYIDCLSHASYLVGDETSGRAVVVDPRRDVQVYLDDAAAAGLRIVGVINTHFHADFVAGHLELAEATGAWIGYGRRADPDYEIRAFAHGDRISLGEVELEIVETPGHTWESVSVLVREHADDRAPNAVLTGDALFNGDVGRPDLAAAVGADPDELARALYVSTHETLMGLPDDVRLLPAHGAGSACGKNIAGELESTIGAQRIGNPSVRPMSADEFVAAVSSGQPAIPAYFAQDAVLNRRLHQLGRQDRTPVPLALADLRAEVDAGAKLLDARAPEEFAEAHLEGSVNVGIDGRFAETAGMFFDLGDRVVIVAEPGREAEVAMRLARIGIDDVAGHLAAPAEVFAEPDQPVCTAERVDVADLERARRDGSATVLDVRNPTEVDTGAIPGSLRIPLADLERRLADIPADRPVIVHCAGGWRSSVGASVLRRAGRTGVADLEGGFSSWEQAVGQPA